MYVKLYLKKRWLKSLFRMQQEEKKIFPKSLTAQTINQTNLIFSKINQNSGTQPVNLGRSVVHPFDPVMIQSPPRYL